MIEKDIETKLRKKVNDTGAMCLKFESPGFNGVPDRIILIPGAKVIFVETKKPKGKERKRQEYVQGLIRAMGFEVFSAVDSVEKALNVVERCKEVINDVGV